MTLAANIRVFLGVHVSNPSGQEMTKTPISVFMCVLVQERQPDRYIFQYISYPGDIWSISQRMAQ